MGLSNIPGLDFACGNAENLPFSDQPFEDADTRQRDQVRQIEELDNSVMRLISESLISKKVARGLEMKAPRLKQVTASPMAETQRRHKFFGWRTD